MFFYFLRCNTSFDEYSESVPTGLLDCLKLILCLSETNNNKLIEVKGWGREGYPVALVSFSCTRPTSSIEWWIITHFHRLWRHLSLQMHVLGPCFFRSTFSTLSYNVKSPLQNIGQCFLTISFGFYAPTSITWAPNLSPIT